MANFRFSFFVGVVLYLAIYNAAGADSSDDGDRRSVGIEGKKENSVGGEVDNIDPSVLGEEGLAVVIDAGSTGSRVYVYKFTYRTEGNDGSQRGDEDDASFRPPLQIEFPAFATKRVAPGVAAFAEEALEKGPSVAALLTAEVEEEEEAEEARARRGEAKVALSEERFHSEGGSPRTLAAYLRRLQRAVVEAIPSETQRSRAFLFFQGTAGVRALPEDQRNALLEAVQLALDTWGLRQLKESSVAVLEGQEEGVLGWLVLNQLLEKLPPKLSFARIHPPHPRPATQTGLTAALIEMGGASAQVVFELPKQTLQTLQRRQPHREEEKVGVSGDRREPPRASSILEAVEGHPELGVLHLGKEEILLFSKSYHGFGRQLALAHVSADSVRLHYEEHKRFLEERRQPAPLKASQRVAGSVLHLPSSPLHEAPFACFPADVSVEVSLIATESPRVIDEVLHGSAEEKPLGERSSAFRFFTRSDLCHHHDEDSQDEQRNEAEEPSCLRSAWDLLAKQRQRQGEEEVQHQLANEELQRLKEKRTARARGAPSFEECKQVRK